MYTSLCVLDKFYFQSKIHYTLIRLHEVKVIRPHYGPGLYSIFNRDEYQEYFLGSKGDVCLRFSSDDSDVLGYF
jgi:hypothetical protein